MKTKEISQDLWINIISIIAVLLLAFNITVAKEKPVKNMKATYSLKSQETADNINKKNNTTDVVIKNKLPIVNRNIKGYKFPILNRNVNRYKLPIIN